VINKGKEQWAMEYRLMKANKEYAFVLDRAHVLHDDNGMPYRMIGSKVEITNLKSIEEELRITNGNLRRINEDLDNFIYTASHDLKAPVSNIEGLVATLSEEMGNQTEDVQYILSLIRNSVDQFKLTIQELTEITKVQKGIYGEEEEVDVKEIAEEVLINIREMIQKNRAQVVIECSHCPRIKFSRKNLKSIIYNLVSNGIKYHHPGRVPVVEVKTRELENEILLSVTDNGLGIPKSKQGKVFSMFKRLHDHVEGTGIGLYIVKRIIENNG
jgi:two-component system CheB/CheR fusion protein